VPAVVIAAPNLLSSLTERLRDEGELVTFTDSEPIQALQVILETRPGLIVLERLFAATPRGAALINRIKNDPQLSGSDVRVMSHTGDYSRQVSKPAAQPAVVAGVVVETPAGRTAPPMTAPAPPVATEEAPRPLDWHGTRRAARHRLQRGIEIQLDGNPATVVDMSTFGAQVLSSTILRPNQKVRVSIPVSDSVARCRATIAWAKFELPDPSAPPVYRAGVEFIDADGETMDRFADRHKA
jgi:CheY-like chemotaxis protein